MKLSQKNIVANLALNIKAKEYKESSSMVTINLTDKLKSKSANYDVIDFVFDDEGFLKQISSELSKEETKDVLNQLVEDNYEKYNK